MSLYAYLLAFNYMFGMILGETDPNILLVISQDQEQPEKEQVNIRKSDDHAAVERVLINYLGAFQNIQARDTYQYLSSEDKETYDLQKWTEYIQPPKHEMSDPLVLMLLKKVTYEVEEIIVNNNNATAIVKCSMPILLMMTFSDRETAKEQIIKGENLPMQTFTNSYQLTKEKTGWKVYFGLTVWSEMEAKRDSAKSLINEAERLVPSLFEEPFILTGNGDLRDVDIEKIHTAIEKYAIALELDTSNSLIKIRLESLEALVEKLQYREKVIVQNVLVGESKSGGYGVWGEVKNTGQRTLTEVTITIYYLDKNSKPIYEDDYHPVLVTESYSRLDNSPLKPNYGRKFGYTADDVPSDWAKKVKIVVTDLDFED